jgi:hypothetical protein
MCEKSHIAQLRRASEGVGSGAFRAMTLEPRVLLFQWGDHMRSIALLLASASALVPVSMAQAAETISYKYDARGRLIEVKRTGSVNNNVQTNYTHDKANNRKLVVTVNSPNAPPP